MLRNDGLFYLDDRLLSEMTPKEIEKLGINELSEEEKKKICKKVGIKYKPKFNC